MPHVLLHIRPPMADQTGMQKDYGNVRRAEEIADGETLHALLVRLADQYGPKFRDALFDEKTKQIKQSIVVVLNTEVLRQHDQFEIPLKGGDTVYFLTTISGG